MKPIRYSFFAILIAAISFVSCKKQPPVEQLIVDGGAAHIVQLPTDTVTLNGTVTSGKTANMSYLWSSISGPNTPVIVSPTSASTLINGLIAGKYVFQFQATNSNGDIAVDTTSVLVTAQPIDTLVAQPANNPNEAYSYSYSPNNTATNNAQIIMAAWTVGGTPTTTRSYMKFDLSQIPANATILSAKFSLYSETLAAFQSYGGAQTPQYGTSDAFYIQRITSGWTTPTVSWNNMPTTTTVNQVTIPQSTSGEEDATDMDVTALVQDMQTNSNNGFALQLVNETPYNQRFFTSSTNSDPTKRPKLVIIYQ